MDGRLTIHGHTSNFGVVEFMTAVDVARRLGVSRTQVARLTQSGRIASAAKAPGIRGAYLFDPAEVERYAEARQAGKVTA